MKKRILFTLMIAGVLTVSSLKAQFSIGPGVHYATFIQTSGVSANANYDFTKKFGAMAGYARFFEKTNLESKDENSWWALDADVTYNLLSLSDKIKLYALAGLNVLYWKYSNEPNRDESETGLNVGAGCKFGIWKKMYLVPEVRLTIHDESDGFFRFGVKLMFGL